MRASYLAPILSLPFLLASCSQPLIGEVNLVLGGAKTPVVGGHCEKYIEIPQSIKTHIVNSQADATDDVGELEAWLLWLHEDVRTRLTGGCASEAPPASLPTH